MTIAIILSFDQRASENFVWINPGQITLTRILASPHSLAKTFVSEINAALETEYMPKPVSGERPPIELILITEAPEDFLRYGKQSRQSSNGALTLTANILSKASKVVWCTGPNTGFEAALLTRISMVPYFSTVFFRPEVGAPPCFRHCRRSRLLHTLCF